MSCNSGLRGEDSDVDIETITDTAWSVEMPGHSIQNISSASAPISTKPLVCFHGTNPGNEIPNPITRSYRIKKIPSRRSGQISNSKASSLTSQSKNSAARCFFILGQEPKLLSDKKLTKAQPQSKYTQVHNRVRCYFSASTTVMSTALARHIYIRNPAVRAIDKEGSYQHYLHKKIKRLISIMPTYTHNVTREMRLYHFTLDSYIHDFDHEFTLMKSKVGSNDYESQFKLLTSKVKSCNADLRRRGLLVNSMLMSYGNDLEKKITLLNYKIAPYAHDLEMQITLINSKINSYVADFRRKVDILNSRSKTFSDYINREHQLLMSERVV